MSRHETLIVRTSAPTVRDRLSHAWNQLRGIMLGSHGLFTWGLAPIFIHELR